MTMITTQALHEGVIVRVEWYDIIEYRHGDYADYPVGDLPLAAAVSYGEYLHMDDEKLVIARETIDDGVDRQVFPIGCVTRVEVLSR